MKYPELKNTPIKETIFSVSYNEIVNEDCFNKFLNLDKIKETFKDVKLSIDQKLDLKSDTVDISSSHSGYYLRSENEVLQLRKGSFSFHYLNGYKKFDTLLNSFSKYWNSFDNLTKDDLTISNFSVRYINVIETDIENKPSDLVQLYPKQSGDKTVHNFHNSIQFSYEKHQQYTINAVSTKINEKGVLLDISVTGKSDNEIKKANLKKLFPPLQEIKNKAFFDSITARALLKYIENK